MTPLHWTAGLHHDGSAMYVSNPLPKHGEVVTLSLRLPASASIRAVFIRSAPDGEHHFDPMREVRRSSADAVSAWWSGELRAANPRNHYRFKFLTGEGAYYYTAAGVFRSERPDWFDFRLLADYAAPEWVSETVFYQIFPDRFWNGDPSLTAPPGAWNMRGHSTQQRPWGAPPLPWSQAGNLDFYGGDLPGIGQKVDYLTNLGINALYITPIFSSLTNHRYDINNFDQVDQCLGGNEGLADLRRVLERAGIRLVLDVTLNHCGASHEWFKQAQADLNSVTAGFFTFYGNPNDYETWLGHRLLPKFNYTGAELRERMFSGHDSVLRKWLREPYRIDGWRLDVANMQGRQGTIQLGHKIGRQIRRAVKAENPQAYLLGEHVFDGTNHLQGDELDAAMNYQGFTLPVWRWLAGSEWGSEHGDPMADPVRIGAETLAEQWRYYRAAVPWVIARQQFNLLGSHDTARILWRLKGDKALTRLGVVLLMTYVGAPSVYYADEIGMDGGPDPDNRRCMVWDEAGWDHDLRNLYTRLIALRRSAPALIRGGFQTLYADGGLMAYQRQSPEQRLIVVGYRGPGNLESVSIPVWHGGLADGATLTDLLGGGTYTVSGGAITLDGLTPGAALVMEEKRS